MRIDSLIQKHRLRMLITFLVCAFFINAKAQVVWNKTYVEDRPIMLFSSIVKTDTSYKIIGLAADKLPPYDARILAADVSEDGTMTKYKVKGDSTNTSYGVFVNSLIKTNKNDFAFTGYATDSLPKLLFARFNATIDSITTYTYYTPNTYAFFGSALLQFDANSFYIAGTRNILSPNNTNVVLVKIDSMGNRLWEKYYDQLKVDYAKSLIALSNGNLMLGAFRTDNNSPNAHANTWLLEIDTGGNIVRQWFDPNDSTYVAEGLLQTQDGGFVYGAQKKFSQTINGIYLVGTIVKMDSNFNKQWTFEGGFAGSETGFSDIIELPDGSFVACGKSNYRDAWIVKLDTGGNVIWSKEYVGIIDSGWVENYLTDIDALPNGGFIAVGQCQFLGHTPPQVGWILKLDSNGCEVENCTLGIDDRQQTEDRRQIQIQPNPASGSVQVELGNEMIGGELKVYDVTGKMLLQRRIETEQMQVDVSNLSKGLYVVVAEKQLKQAIGKLVVE